MRNVIGVSRPVEPGSIVVFSFEQDDSSDLTVEAIASIRREIVDAAGHDRFVVVLAEATTVVSVLGPHDLAETVRSAFESAGVLAARSAGGPARSLGGERDGVSATTEAERRPAALDGDGEG